VSHSLSQLIPYIDAEQEVADGMSKDVALEVMKEVQAEEDSLLSLRANDELAKLSDHLVDAAILRHLADRSLSPPRPTPPCMWVWVKSVFSSTHTTCVSSYVNIHMQPPSPPPHILRV